MVIISLKNIVKRYNQKIALNNVNLELKKNSTIGIVGNNGSGKTTLINIICNLINFDVGEVQCFGKSIQSASKSYKRKFGIVLSDPYFIENFKVSEFLLFVAKFQFILKKERINSLNKVLNFFDLIKYQNSKIKTLSSGNKSKLSVAAAMIHNPEVLILDEPFVNLDISSSDKLLRMLKAIKSNRTILITSHNLSFLIDLCDEFVILDHGKIILHLHKKDYNNSKLLKVDIQNNLIEKKENLDFTWLD